MDENVFDLLDYRIQFTLYYSDCLLFFFVIIISFCDGRFLLDMIERLECFVFYLYLLY